MVPWSDRARRSVMTLAEEDAARGESVRDRGQRSGTILVGKELKRAALDEDIKWPGAHRWIAQVARDEPHDAATSQVPSAEQLAEVVRPGPGPVGKKSRGR